MENMNWRCIICGEPVGSSDMVGYVRDTNGNYIKGSLGFWHCGEKCAGKFRKLMPSDTHIEHFMNNMPQHLAIWANENIDKEDLGKMIMVCLQEGYQTAVPFYNEAVDHGVIEPNLQPPLLWGNEVDAILDWKKNR